MFKKLNFKTLLILFGVLFVLVILMKVVQHSKGDRNFKATLFEVDTAKISSIIINPHGSKEEVKLLRTGREWTLVKKNNRTYKTEKGAVEGMLNELSRIKAEFVAGMDKSDWAQYQVTDTASTHVQVEQAGKTVADFYVGKVSFQQYQQTSYIRVNNDDHVYAVDGMLPFTFSRNADDYRNKTMVQVNSPSDISKLEFNYPDSSYVMFKDNNNWIINNTKADSTKAAEFINSIAYLSGSEFVDDSELSGNQVFSLKIEGKNFQPIELKAYQANAANQYVVTSSINSEGRFSGIKGDLVKHVFVGPDHFKATPKKTDKNKGKKK
ncbi:MAG TPA: DUF4340 domain-containing protein [Bacteroidales bacterium]